MENNQPIKSNEKIDALFLRKKILEITSIEDLASEFDAVNVDSYLNWYSKKKYGSYLEYSKDGKSVKWFFQYSKMLDQLKIQLQKKQEENQNKSIEAETERYNNTKENEPVVRTNKNKPIYSSDGSHIDKSKVEDKGLTFAEFCTWISKNNREITKMYSTDVENKIHNFLVWILKKVNTDERKQLNVWVKSVHTFIQKDLRR